MTTTLMASVLVLAFAVASFGIVFVLTWLSLRPLNNQRVVERLRRDRSDEALRH